MAGSPFRGMEGGITQDNHPPINLLNQPLKGVIRDIGRGTRPPHDQSPLIEEQTEFPADNPAVIGEAFAADLLRATAFAHGVDQLNAIRVDDPEHGRSGQEDLCPVLMGLEETKEPGALGGRVADLHFTPMCAMLLTASEGERHGTHARAVSPLS